MRINVDTVNLQKKNIMSRVEKFDKWMKAMGNIYYYNNQLMLNAYNIIEE